ncbi:hypothetical protein BGZ65_002053 [Modicella reniformis]|uniref:Serine/threonine-protein phosphatase 2A activator n=1 Tax=Modicella reniformis TaxID=1440133 RepID=A0A9P6J3B7_9FUNG|nr:hypothetical protein BGZ65_002053 [Modicella reniformis]
MANQGSPATTAPAAPPAADTFIEPVKCIKDEARDLPFFQASEGYARILSYILALNNAVLNRKPINKIVALLDILDSWIELVPPKSDPQRYGNIAFREYVKLFEDKATEVLEQLLPSTMHPAIQEISPYLTQSMGHGTRIDYGSGHELSFVAWLCCLEIIGFLEHKDHAAVVLRTFVRYLELVRRLQRTYQLEPAGSHGVWGLDDYQFLPYLWGSAQLREHPRMKPVAVMNVQLVEDYASEYMYFRAIQSIHQTKRGPFHEHSPVLFEISGVPHWPKVNSGMIKMYKVEVLSKFPVVPLLPPEEEEEYLQQPPPPQQQEHLFPLYLVLVLVLVLALVIQQPQASFIAFLIQRNRFRVMSTTKQQLEGLHSVRTLNDNNKIPLFGLGVYLTEAGKQTEDAVLWALQAGYRHIDTATSYENEENVGNAIRKSGIPREQIFVTTKLTEDDQGYDSAIAALNLSLKKLGLDYVDLYLIHSPLRGSEMRLESWKALEELVLQGKTKSIGVSNYGVHHLQELLDTNPNILPVVNQIEVHPWLNRPHIIQYCHDKNIAVESYSPLCQSHKLTDERLTRIAGKYNSKSPAQVLIRWNLQHGNIVIPKSANKKRIQENANVFDFELADEDMAVLDSMNEGFFCDWDPTIAP